MVNAKTGTLSVLNHKISTRIRVVATVVAIAALLLLSLTLVFPHTALAGFMDVVASDGNGATDFSKFETESSKAIGTSADGADLEGSKISPGTYSLPTSSDITTFMQGTNHVVTSSTMCRVSDCTVTVGQDGSLTASFSLTQAFNYIYFGTAEEAAAAASSQDDDSPFIAGSWNGSGWDYTVQIPSLNTVFNLATYSRDNSKAWFDRKIIFVETDEIATAVYDKRREEEKKEESGSGDDGNKEDSNKSSSNGSSGGSSSKSSSEKSSNGDKSKDEKKDSSSSSGSASGSGSGSGGGSGSGYGSGSGSGSVTSTNINPRSGNNTTSDSSSSSSSSSSAKRGILLHPASGGSSSAEEVEAALPEIEPEETQGFSKTAVMIASSFIILLVIGVLARVLIFEHQLALDAIYQEDA